MKFYLIVAKGKHKGMPIEITVDLFMIGSKKMCQLRSKLDGVGEEHCALLTRDRKVFVRDMNSGFNTLLNGERVPPGEEWPMHAADRLEVGPLEFLVQFREAALSKRDLEEWAAKCLDVASEREIPEMDERFHKPSDAAEAAASIIDRLQTQRGLVMGRLRIGKDGGITTVRFNDANLVDEAEVALIKKELQQYLARANLRVLLDFKNVRRLSSSAVNMLGDFCLWLQPWGSTLALCRVRADLMPIISTMGLTFPIFQDKRLALVAKW